MKEINDQQRYRHTLIMAHTGWWGTVLIVSARTFGWLPQEAGSLALLTLGLGVTGSLALSRMRLGRTITEVFQAGMRAAITLSANVFTDTCIMAVDKDGRVVSVDHSDAIGWEADKLLGKNLLCDLVITRSGVSGTIRKLEPGTSITTPMRNQDGGAFDARISLAELDQQVGDVRVERMIATVSPVVSSTGHYTINE
jgi:hypothetical protein